MELTDIIKEENLVLQKSKLLTDNVMHYCPGCTHGVVHKLIAEVIEELNIQDQTIGVSPVGCSVFAYNYIDIDWAEAAHGRAPAVATGAKRVVGKDSLGFTYQGGGGLASIGTAGVPGSGMIMLTMVLETVGLRGFERRSINQLSGGQQQRVAIARSLVNQPRVLLLDEPLGALDLKLRKEMQLELKRLQREMNITFVYVTHDQEEALTMSDTVVVMNKGNIQQIGSPQDIYNEPRNAFVAKFIGDSNIVDGIMEKDFLVSFGGQEFACVDRGFKPREPVQVVIRPEDVDIVPPAAGKLTGLVREVIFKGVHFEMHVDVEGKEWLIHSTQASQPGELIGMNIGPDEIHIMSREEV